MRTSPEDALMETEAKRKRFYVAAAIITALSIGTITLYSVLQFTAV